MISISCGLLNRAQYALFLSVLITQQSFREDLFPLGKGILPRPAARQDEFDSLKNPFPLKGYPRIF